MSVDEEDATAEVSGNGAVGAPRCSHAPPLGRYTPGPGFPFFEMGILFFASLVSALPLTGLFPYVAYMVVDLHEAPSVDHAGFVSGYVASAFMLGRLVSSFYWGMLCID